MRHVLALTAALLALPAAAQDSTPGDAAAGAELFWRYCSACHGQDARGGGPMMEILTIPAPDLTALVTGNAGAFPTTRVIWRIDGRDPLLAHGGEMPIFGDFFQGEDTALKAETGQPILTSGVIADLVAWLVSVQR